MTRGGSAARLGLVLSAGFARAIDAGGGIGGGLDGPLRWSGMGEHVVMIYGKEPA
jgi:hypothetical protein